MHAGEPTKHTKEDHPAEHPDWARRHRELLSDLGRKYVWWVSPDEMLEFPGRVVAQVMNIGSFRDVHRMAAALGDDVLRTVLSEAEAGQFSARSWHYWHYRLGLAEPGKVPPLPVKSIPAA